MMLSFSVLLMKEHHLESFFIRLTSDVPDQYLHLSQSVFNILHYEYNGHGSDGHPVSAFVSEGLYSIRPMSTWALGPGMDAAKYYASSRFEARR